MRLNPGQREKLAKEIRDAAMRIVGDRLGRMVLRDDLQFLCGRFGETLHVSIYPQAEHDGKGKVFSANFGPGTTIMKFKYGDWISRLLSRGSVH